MTSFRGKESKTTYVPFEETQYKKRENIAFSFTKDLVITDADEALLALAGRDLAGRSLTVLLKHPEDAAFFSHLFDAPKLFPERALELVLKEGGPSEVYVLIFRPDYADGVVTAIRAVGFIKPKNETGVQSLLDDAAFMRQSARLFEESKTHGDPFSVMVLFSQIFKDFNMSQASFHTEALDVTLSALFSVLPETAIGTYRTEDHIVFALPGCSEEAALLLKEKVLQAIRHLLVSKKETSFFLRTSIGVSGRQPSDTGIHTVLDRALLSARAGL